MTTVTAEITDTQWQAILVRDRRADGRFVYGVITTGIFCRPSCPAKRPNPDNVRIFPNGQTALQAGFRPCRRCTPLSPAGSPVTDIVIALCRYIEQSHDLPTLKDLASQCGWSRHHLQRQF
ncbi:MAG: methylphosphotriester-DNA--protein-cysteine methyltransferase family protein, partial [Alcanivorax sp.]|nr:methylphosphotriester-DNA--protein-cysteine methyltransferase family protein [Alcanivorax sp.]